MRRSMRWHCVNYPPKAGRLGTHTTCTCTGSLTTFSGWSPPLMCIKHAIRCSRWLRTNWHDTGSRTYYRHRNPRPNKARRPECTPPDRRKMNELVVRGLVDSRSARSTVMTSACAGPPLVPSAILPALSSRAYRRSLAPYRPGRSGFMRSSVMGSASSAAGSWTAFGC